MQETFDEELSTAAPANQSLYYDDLASKVKVQSVAHSDAAPEGLGCVWTPSTSGSSPVSQDKDGNDGIIILYHHDHVSITHTDTHCDQEHRGNPSVGAGVFGPQWKNLHDSYRCMQPSVSAGTIWSPYNSRRARTGLSCYRSDLK